jgi:DNA-binding transcriptional MerR regulator
MMKYLTTLEVANELSVSKQTLLNWLYAGKLAEPPRNKKGYRLWSPSRVSQAKRLIGDGRLHRRTVLHREGPEEVEEFARDVAQSLRDAQIELRAFVRVLTQVHGSGRPRAAASAPKARSLKRS